ncbi:MAG: DNA-3-methyladenine glycosylase I [Phycisphaerales bacterium]|nr:MAG: DNA-3-methyladenine glycosylase I [Phycisphaerales bacterium]
MPDPATEPDRCPWSGDDPLYVRYHDEEWGVPSRNETHLFEMLCLEGQQAGLSWITVLKKRERYREVFCGFDAAELADRGDAIVKRAIHDPGVIRHRGKLDAIVTNARATLRLREETGPLSEHLWSFVGGEPVVNRLKSLAEAPSVTEASTRMSKDLKKRGFAFVGPTTCYAFMQAVGMVNDHLVSCFRHPECM